MFTFEDRPQFDFALLLSITVLSISVLSSCAAATLPPTVVQAQAVSESNAAAQAKEYSPQALADAEKLKAEANFLHSEGRQPEAGAAGEQALAAFYEAFALAQIIQAEERLLTARTSQQKASAELERLDQLQSQVERDAQSFEMQARVALDMEAVKDTTVLTPARAQARRAAAQQLTAEAALLCLGAELLHQSGESFTLTKQKLATLNDELTVGSLKSDLYHRATELRAACLHELTLVRRPVSQQAPQSSESDELLSAISSAEKYMVFRDDRGIVVNLGQPLATAASESELTQFTKEALAFLGAVSKRHKNFPLLVVVHTSKRGESKRATLMGQLANEALGAAGAEKITVISVDNAHPVVPPSMREATGKNERIEIVFVVPGR